MIKDSKYNRFFATVHSIINPALREHGLSIKNPFVGKLTPVDQNRVLQGSVDPNSLRKIQRHCRDMNDEPRWLIALNSTLVCSSVVSACGADMEI